MRARPLVDLLREKNNKFRDPSECWEWLGSKNSRGYGRVVWNGKNVRAHRVAWELANGPIPEGKCVLHYCDNPSCVNPHHLWVGSHADNMHDMVEKGRQVYHRGESHGMSKLTEQDVREIRFFLDAGYSQKALALMYGVSISTISLIKTGKIWRCVK